MSFAVDEISEATMEACERYAHLVALVVASKSMYGDVFEVARRRKAMTITSSWSGVSLHRWSSPPTT
jgi:hypothetical protein